MNHLDTKTLLQDSKYLELKRHIIEKTGLVYFQDKDLDLCHRLLKRFDATGTSSCEEYLERLKSQSTAAEFDSLASELVIGETYFLRHLEQFEALKTTILPDIIERNRDTRKIRIWCAGCSIGAEPYSIATLIIDEFATQLFGWDIKITGTDLNREFLAKAESGKFDEWSFRTTEADFRSRHFTQEGRSWVIRPNVKSLVEFKYHNLMETAALNFSMGSLDLILCRNVMIYFDQSAIEKVISNFETSLSDTGWLVIGHAEQPHGATRLKLVQLPKVTVYQKTDSFSHSVTSSNFHFKPPVFHMPTHDAKPLKPVIVQDTVRHVQMKNDHVTPDSISYLRRLADAGQFDLAIKQCGDLIALDPTNAVVYFYRALVLEQLGRVKEVEESLRSALRLDPKFIMAQYTKALLHEKRGERARMAESFRTVHDLLENLASDFKIPESDDITAGELRSVVSNRLKVA